MADSISLTDGNVSIALIYNAANTYQLKVRYGVNIAAMEPRPTWHTSEEEEPQLVDTTPQNRQAIFNIIALEATDTANADALIALELLLNQAETYSKTGIGARVTLNVSLDGLSNATVHEVIYGVIEAADRGGIHSEMSREGTIIYDMQVRLVLKPYGEASSVLTLKNELASSPHGLEDSNSDGLADGWNLSATPPDSYALDTSLWLFGGQCQKFACNATGTKGVYFDAVTASTSTQAVAFVWMRTLSTSGTPDTVYVRLLDGSSNLIQEKAYQAADAGGVADKKWVGQDGGTWRRVVVSGTNTTAANFILSISRKTADGSAANTTVLIQCGYLQTGTTTAPDGWCSASLDVHTRGDVDSTNEDEIYYFDTAMIPGDAPAHVAYKVNNASANVYAAIFSNLTEGKNGAVQLDTWRDTALLSASWTTGTTGSYTGASYYTYNDTDALASVPITFDWDVSALPELAYYTWDIYAIVEVANTAITFDAVVGDTVTTSATLLSNVALNATGGWYAVRAGTFAPRTVIDVFDNLGTSDSFTDLVVTLTFDISGGTYGANAVKVDGMFLMPSSGKASCNYEQNLTDFGVDYRRLAGMATTSYYYRRPALVSQWHLTPGPKVNRLFNLWLTGANYEYTNSTNGDITAIILPRTKYLFGSV